MNTPPSSTAAGTSGYSADACSDLRERLVLALQGTLPVPMDARGLMSAEECRGARPAAVLLAIEQGAEGAAVVLTRRTDHLATHAGQISFAGGRRDPSDRDVVHTALREAREEIGLDPRMVQVLGQLPEFFVPSGYRVTPVLAWLERTMDLQADPAEVAEVFRLPVSLALNPDAWHTELVERSGQQRRLWAMEFEGRRIWGATAAILVWLASRLRDTGPPAP